MAASEDGALPRARVIRAILALGMDPSAIEQVIIEPGMVRAVSTVRDEYGARVGLSYSNWVVIDVVAPPATDGQSAPALPDEEGEDA
jgi:hypothetical protein